MQPNPRYNQRAIYHPERPPKDTRAKALAGTVVTVNGWYPKIARLEKRNGKQFWLLIWETFCLDLDRMISAADLVLETPQQKDKP